MSVAFAPHQQLFGHLQPGLLVVVGEEARHELGGDTAHGQDVGEHVLARAVRDADGLGHLPKAEASISADHLAHLHHFLQVLRGGRPSGPVVVLDGHPAFLETSVPLEAGAPAEGVFPERRPQQVQRLRRRLAQAEAELDAHTLLFDGLHLGGREGGHTTTTTCRLMMIPEKRVQHLVVDTMAFIKNVPLQKVAVDIYTVPEVIHEIRNKRQLRNLVVLPYDLKVRDAFPEDVAFIMEFSKKTGDYPSLSATDIKVMALTYRLEKEHVGTDHLKTEVQMNRIVTLTRRLPEVHGDVAGFYNPSSMHRPQGVSEEQLDSSVGAGNSDGGDAETNAEDLMSMEELEKTIRDAIVDDKWDSIRVVGCDDDDDGGGSDDGEEEEDDNDDTDDEGWITPSNIKQVKQEMHSDVSTDLDAVVACVSGDFAMQNVLKHVGLRVMSWDGQMITHLRTFILRCYSCFKCTSVMTKVFCPHCGNRTLKKVAVAVAEDGTLEIHLSARVRLTGRGKRFSLPAPRGGKHAVNPILCEDQPRPDQRPSRLARTKNNPLDPDYLAGYSPFVMRDTTSRSAMLGFRGAAMKNWMRKNPNEVRKKGRTKRK